MDASRIAQDVTDQAERSEQAAFNHQHALAKEGERAATAITAKGQQELQQQHNDKARREHAASDAARFDPQDLDEPPAQSSNGVDRGWTGRRFVDDDDLPDSWLT